MKRKLRLQLNLIWSNRIRLGLHALIFCAVVLSGRYVVCQPICCGNDTYTWEFFSPYGETLMKGDISQDLFEVGPQPWEVSNQPLTGTLVVFYSTGHIRYLAQYKEGKLNGDAMYFEQTGILAELAQYESGEEVGIRLRLYNSGRPETLYFYPTNGVRNLEGYTWHTNGILESASYSKDNIAYDQVWNMQGKLIADGVTSNYIENGTFVSYQLRGQPPVIGIFSNGVRISIYQENEK